MRFLSLLFAAVVSRMAAAELSFTASAVHQGRKVDTSGLEFVPIPPRSKGHFRHGNGTYSGRNSTSGGGGHHRRSSVSSSSDWCGVSQHSTAQNPITSVYGVFSAPSLSFRPNLPYPQSGAAWVGIDGASCQTALLQAGITTVVCPRQPHLMTFKKQNAYMNFPSSSIPTASRVPQPFGNGCPTHHIPSVAFLVRQTAPFL